MGPGEVHRSFRLKRAFERVFDASGCGAGAGCGAEIHQGGAMGCAVGGWSGDSNITELRNILEIILGILLYFRVYSLNPLYL